MKTPEEILYMWSLNSKDLDWVETIRNVQTEAYNQAIRDAAENAEVKEEFGNPYDPHSNYYVVDEQSILKLLK